MRKTIVKAFFFIVACCIGVNSMLAQSYCADPIFVCDVVELDGIGLLDVVSLPEIGIDSIQPSSLCDTDVTSGTPDNPVWYSFIAGTTSITINISPKNCTEIPNSMGGFDSGIQGVVFDDCAVTEDGTFGLTLDCDASGVQDGEVMTLTSNEFVCGHTYFLMLDGYTGSVCEYSIEITEGIEEYELPDIDRIEFDLNLCSPYPLCEGVEVPFEMIWDGASCLPDESTSMYYEWKVSPVTTLYPTGDNPDHSSSVVSFTFTDAGTYSISCIARTVDLNGGFCDATNIGSVDITVLNSTPIDEVFTKVEICQEDFPLFLTLTEDPNGDGVIGWLGGPAMSAGISTHIVETDCGCEYTQTIEIEQIDLAPRIDIDTVFCTSIPGPYIIEGISITKNLDTAMTFVAASGCDSLVNLKATFMEVSGVLSLGACADSVSIIFTSINQVPNTIDDVIYRWENSSSMPILDSNNIDSILNVVSEDTYSLYLTLMEGTTSCEFFVGDITVDFDNLSPVVPISMDWPTSICPGTSNAIFKLEDNGLESVYDWSYPADVVEVSGQGSSEITLDWSSSVGGEVCVKRTSICGTSDSLCQQINLEILPLPDFDIYGSTCIGQEVSVVYTGSVLLSYDYIWDFDGATIVNNATGAGPYSLKWSSGGEKIISLHLSNGVCNTEVVLDSLIISEQLPAPNFNCESSGDSIIVSWIEDPLVQSYEVAFISGSIGVVVDNKYISSGLINGDFVEIAVYGTINDDCSETYTDTIKCELYSCPSVSLVLSGEEVSFCNNTSGIIKLNSEVIGDNTGTGLWSGEGLIDADHFEPRLLNPGLNYFKYTYVLGGCSYVDSVEIELYDELSIVIDETLPMCWNDTTGTIDITNSSGVNLQYAMNNGDFSDETHYTVLGPYAVVAMDDNLCEHEFTGSINSPNKPNVTLSGKEDIRLGDNAVLSLLTDIDNSRIDSIIWYNGIQRLCFDCTDINLLQESFSVEYCAIIHYDGNCSVEVCKVVNATDVVGVYFPNIMSTSLNEEHNSFIIDIGHRGALLKSIIIFDHWGGQLFKKNNVSITGNHVLWDGTFKGELVQPGVYVYVYELELNDGRVIKDSGDITIVR